MYHKRATYYRDGCDTFQLYDEHIPTAETLSLWCKRFDMDNPRVIVEACHLDADTGELITPWTYLYTVRS